MLLLLGSFFLFLAKVSAQGQPEEQNFAAVLTSEILLCDDEMSKIMFDPSGLEVIMPNDSISFINGSITFHKPITAEHIADLTLIKQENNQAKLVLSVCINLCEEMLNPESDYEFIFRFFDVGGQCPFTEGIYPILMFVLDLRDMPINGSNTGCYIAKISVNLGACDDNEKTFEGCIYLSFCIEAA